jgi:hypothetical protein
VDDGRGGAVIRGVSTNARISADETGLSAGSQKANPESIFQTEEGTEEGGGVEGSETRGKKGGKESLPLLAAPGDAILFPSHKHHMVTPVR